jgi:hypothetical protein
MTILPKPRPWRLRGPFFAALFFAALYLAVVRWRHHPRALAPDLGGYYNYLTHGFAEGHLHVPIQPSKEILAAPNPQDPSLPIEWKMHDMALYKGRYYLYHGAAPVLLVFGPWRMLWGVDLPEAIAGWLFVSAGLWALFLLARPLTPWKAVALGCCSGLLVLLPRILVYEIAISCGFACLAWAFVFHQENEDWLAGLCLGLALLSRPHLALAVPFFRWRSWIGLGVAGGILALYNYARFGSPFELGLKYLLSGPDQQVPVPGLAKFFTALYLLVFQVPEPRAAFPYFASRWHSWFPPPAGMYREPLLGAIVFAPFLVTARAVQTPYFATGLLTLGFVAFTGWVTQRYLVDFLPWLVLGVLPATDNRFGKALIALGASLAILDILRS